MTMGKIFAGALGAIVAVMVAYGVAGCPQPPKPAPGPDADANSPPPPPASDGAVLSDICAHACEALALAGCREGDPAPTPASACYKNAATIEKLRLNPNPAKGGAPLTCADLTAAKTPADVRAMGQECNGQR